MLKHRVGKRYGQGREVQHDWQRKAEFGLASSDKWPAEGMPERMINGVLHKVLPKGEELNGTRYRGRRAVAQCPVCAKWVCAGHIGQHHAIHVED